MRAGQAFAFDRFVLDPARRALLADGEPVSLGARALDILTCLVNNPATPVSKHQLLSAVWPGRTVEENNLTVHISALRRALGDGRDGARFVATLQGQGYCFVAPVSVVEAEPDAAPGEPPRAKRLPTPGTPFVGRGEELAAIVERMKTHRLLTIVGVGGIGKTRIALKIGQDLASSYAGGVHLVELAPVADPGLLVETVAGAFQVGGAAVSSVERLIGFLADQELLLILDNCEHVVDAVARLAGTILARCPRVAMLATSRERLSIDRESVYRLPPFAVPAPDRPIDAETALGYDAVRLFVDRAADALGGFTLDNGNAAAVAHICSRLDGIALAIEMAVPRLMVLNPAQLADWLSERSRLPGSQNRGTVERHRTLRAVFDWSWELLTGPERRLLRHLAVFVGGANLEAVVAVAGPGPAATDADVPDILDSLAALVEKSLVIADMSGREPRYRMLETTRQYASARLAEAGDREPRLAHARHFAQFFAQAEAEWPTTSGAAWLEAYGGDADNLRAALDWAFGPDGDAALALQLVAHSGPLWWELPQLPLNESGRWFDRAVDRIAADTPPAIAARLWFGKSWRDFRFADRENFPAAAEAIRRFRAAGEPVGLGAALWRAGSALLTAETADAAAPYLNEAVMVLRGQAPSKWLALALVRQGDLLFRQGDLAAARPAFEEGLRLARLTGHWFGLVNGGSNLAELLLDPGEGDRAIALMRGLRAELLPSRAPPLLATLATHLLLAGAMTEAQAALREAIPFARASGLAGVLGWAAQSTALMTAQAGKAADAARLDGFARRVHPSVATRAGGHRRAIEQLDRLLADQLDAAERARLMAEGAAWIAEQAADTALRLLDARRPDGSSHSTTIDADGANSPARPQP